MDTINATRNTLFTFHPLISGLSDFTEGRERWATLNSQSTFLSVAMIAGHQRLVKKI
jgi:hypothetical protein